MQERIRKISALFVFSLLMLSASVGCNTVEGLGQDIENAGEGLESASN
jgi:predicted small secreted protein